MEYHRMLNLYKFISIYFNIFNLHLNSAASWKPRHVASVFAGVKGRASQVHPAQHAEHKKQSLDFLQTSSTMSTFICQHLSAVYSEWLRARLLPLEELTALRCLAWRSRVSFCNFASAMHSAVQPAMLSMLFHAPLYSPWLAMTCHDLPWLAMTCHDLPWLAMTCHDLPWLATTCHDLPRLATTCHDLPRLATTCHDLPRLATTCHDLPRLAMTCHDLPWLAMTCHDLPWLAMTCHDLPWLAMTCHDLPWLAMTCHDLPWLAMTCHDLPWLAMTCHDCPCLVTRTALELQSVHLGLLSKADYCTILYSAHEYIEQYNIIHIYIYTYEQLGKLMQSFSFDPLIHSVLPALQKVIWATECPPRKQWSRSDVTALMSSQCLEALTHSNGFEP